MDLVSNCPLSAWSFLWQSHDGRHAQTVVVKATFALAPGTVALAEEQDPANEEDGFWNDDPTRSVVSPSDRTPYKARGDVMLVGHAYASNKQPVRLLVTRLIVGDLDKSIEVFCDRGFRMHDGQLLEGQRFTKSRLSWERAAGGPDTKNPIGMRFDAQPDAYGIVAIPNLQPPGLFVSKRSDVFIPVCYGPIAPSWPGRTQWLGRLAGSFPTPGWSDRPLPEGLDPAFFQAAPPDQQVAEIRQNERIILENLHPEHPRLVTALPGLKPRAFVDRATGEHEEVAFVADTLLIDTDRSVCVVSWRGSVGLRHAHEAGRITVAMIEDGAAPVRRAAVAAPSTNDDDDEDIANGTRTIIPANETARPPSNPFVSGSGAGASRVMPFVGPDQNTFRPAAPAPRPSDAALPFQRSDQPASMGHETSSIGPSWLKERPVSPAVKPWPMNVGPAAAPPVAPPMGPPAMAPPGTVVAPVAGAPAPPMKPAPVLPSQVAPPASMTSAPIPHARPSDPASSPWASSAPTGAIATAVGLGAVAVVASSASSAKAGSAQAMSDAAADAQTRSAPPVQPAIKPLLATSSTNKSPRPSNGDILDLIWFEESFVPRIRSHWEKLVTELDFEPADPRQDVDAEDPDKARVRHNVFGILSDGDVVEPSGISRIVNEAVNQRGRFTPPLALTGGELRFPFDEVETLKAMIVAMTPFLGSDKRLKEMVDSMTELLKTPYLQGSTGIVDKLARDLRAQFRESNRSLPATYLDGHVERLLLEQRRYAIRKVFGGEFIRALLTVPAEGGMKGSSDSSIPVYLPKQLDQTLPMLVSMKVRMIVEAHLQQDPYDTSPYALRTVALGRSYQLDMIRGGVGKA